MLIIRSDGYFFLLKQFITLSCPEATWTAEWTLQPDSLESMEEIKQFNH